MSRLFNFEVAWLRPPRAMQDVYTQFATELMRQKSGQLDLLDEEDGLLYRWSAICAQQLALLSAELATPETVELWTLERNTWQLVRALYTERLAEPVPSSSRQPSAYAAPFAVVQAVVTASPALLELSTVRDWLSNIVDSRASAIEVRAGYYTFTKNSLKQQRRTGKKGEARVVTELDPDAGLRQGSRLQVEDAVYERALVRSLYAYVRSGELDLAVDLCRKSDQSWRAASLSGGNFCSDPLLKVAGDGMDDGLGDARGMDDDVRATGNKRRKLWKKMCRRAAATTSLDPYERALYGSVSGDVASVLPVCETWEDHLWVHISALLEQGVEDGLELEAARGNGAFWVNGATVPTPSSAPVRTEESTKKELASIFDGLLKGTKLGGGKDPFHVSQTYLILGNINALFENFLTRIEALGEELDPETSAQLLRFFAHLILTMRLMGVPMNEATANRIIQGYIQVLEATEQDDTLIAFYASNLDDEQSTESYAQFLLTFGPTSDLDTRRMALLKTREHGLDLAKIACRTVELVLSDILLESPETEPNASLETRITLSEKDTGLIRSLEWLTFDESTHEEALRQANALCRYFMGLAKPHAARALLLLLPRQLVSNLTASQAAADTNTTSDHALRREMTEYLDFTAFFACLETHTHCTEVWSRKPKSTATKLERASFKDGIFGLVSEFYTAAVELLGNNWLKRDVGEIIDTVDGRRRAVELARIRKIFVPELVMRVHLTLFETASLAPSHLETALSLANLVADEKTQLYLEFITPEQNRIGEYLQRVREAALVQLDGPKL